MHKKLNVEYDMNAQCVSFILQLTQHVNEFSSQMILFDNFPVKGASLCIYTCSFEGLMMSLHK